MKRLVGVMVMAVVSAQAAELATVQGVEVGVAVAGYKYEEPSISVEDSGANLSALATGTVELGGGVWGKADYRGRTAKWITKAPPAGRMTTRISG